METDFNESFQNELQKEIEKRRNGINKHWKLSSCISYVYENKKWFHANLLNSDVTLKLPNSIFLPPSQVVKLMAEYDADMTTVELLRKSGNFSEYEKSEERKPKSDQPSTKSSDENKQHQVTPREEYWCGNLECPFCASEFDNEHRLKLHRRQCNFAKTGFTMMATKKQALCAINEFMWDPEITAFESKWKDRCFMSWIHASRQHGFEDHMSMKCILDFEAQNYRANQAESSGSNLTRKRKSKNSFQSIARLMKRNKL
ncbi:unnamed protein product [Thelazia callipaeda]|uniref:C2H2-type domain-containing protein n=1 Tax=Thelazia callipaeda TaxID=103827 RepID=A0A0N5D7S8_THECL|nr:unnamed protein product [Thelazia callipaeda]